MTNEISGAHKFAFLQERRENAVVIPTKSANPFRILAWTFLVLSLAVVIFYNVLKNNGPVPSEEMQLRDAAQRAPQQTDSN
jgi:hypothetical protein